MVAAGKLDDLGPSGEAAGQAHRAHGGLGAGVHQAHPLHRGDPGDDLGGQLGLARGGRTEGQPVGSRPLHRLHDGRVGVAQNHRPPGADEVDVAVAVGVGEPAAFR